MRHLESKPHHSTASLSQLLYEGRPLLKPILFIRSKDTPTLFLEEEEIFRPVADEAGRYTFSPHGTEFFLLITLLPLGGQEASHVPTAERVFRIFHDDGVPDPSGSPSDVEELLEIDFTDLGKVMNEVESLEAAAAFLKKTTSTNAENPENQAIMMTVGELNKGVCIKDMSSRQRHSHPPTNPIPVEHPKTRTLDDMDEDDEIIVYIAPYPRNGKLAPSPIQSSSAAAASLPPAVSGPVSTDEETCGPPHVATSPAEPSLQFNPAPSPSPTPSPPLKLADTSPCVISGSSDLASRARGARHIPRRMSQYAKFGSFGAIRAEAALREVDPRRDEQRRGDSDVDWGDSMSEGSSDDGGMLVDQDVDPYAMGVFVKGMSTSGITHVSADDVEDEAKIRAEEEREEEDDGESGAESGDSADDTESELAGDVRVALIPVGESELTFGDALLEDKDESTSDEEETPKRSFQARLERLRQRTKGPIKDVSGDELDQELEDDEDGSIIAKIQVTRSFNVLPAINASAPGFR